MRTRGMKSRKQLIHRSKNRVVSQFPSCVCQQDVFLLWSFCIWAPSLLVPCGFSLTWTQWVQLNSMPGNSTAQESSVPSSRYQICRWIINESIWFVVFRSYPTTVFHEAVAVSWAMATPHLSISWTSAASWRSRMTAMMTQQMLG